MTKPKQKDLVSSKIELTTSKSKGKEKVGVDGRSLSLQQYHSTINEMGKKVEKFAMSLSDNLLSVKMALMQAVQTVERKMRENKEKG